MSDNTEIVPITTAEKDWLMSVYTQRKDDLFFMGCIRCIIITAAYSAVVLGLIAFAHDIFFNDAWFTINAALSWVWLKILLIILIAIGTCTLSYFYWILPFKQDALSGVKMRKPYIITSKEYFSGTDQYFIKIDSPIDQHYEVTEQVYNNCKEGGEMIMEQAIKSGYIFSENNHERVTQFNIFRQRGYNAYSDDTGYPM